MHDRQEQEQNSTAGGNPPGMWKSKAGGGVHRVLPQTLCVAGGHAGAKLLACVTLGLAGSFCLPAADLRLGDEASLRLPVPGDYGLRLLSPSILELRLITTKLPDPAPLTEWNLVGPGYQFLVPATNDFLVTIGVQPVTVQAVGFKRRVLYAPLAQRDLRIANHLYFQLSRALSPTADPQTIEVVNVTGTLWSTSRQFQVVSDPLRYSPAIHVNQVGYAPSLPKKAIVGCYLGNLGEMDVQPQLGFRLVDDRTGAAVFYGSLAPRKDIGYNYTPLPYQKVLEADFSDFQTPGAYRLVVPGLGASLPFRIDDGAVMAFVRAYALGLYHQRCGTNNALPFTRHTHGNCHTAAAAVPVPEFDFATTWYLLERANADVVAQPDHPAPRLKDEVSQLYPFVNRGEVDVSGGHHDAGDYSKYTINSAALVHYLMFAVDAFPGVAELDNLGIPESGDGVGDLMQEAKWEADFLAKMQDADGGFYFLVYPRDRQYESNVLPDQGDPQLVWPKNTAVTAAAVAALAQCASSPRFQRHYPAEAALYLQKAHWGWNFLTNAIARRGKAGAYQKLTHYGDNFRHNDELAWAACEMYLATGDPVCQQKLLQWFPDPADRATWRWGWWRMSEFYGSAMRSYAFAARTGRLPTEKLDAGYLTKCETEVVAAGSDATLWSQQSAYGSSLPSETKRVRGAGWYFSSDQAFDITAAYQLDPRPAYLAAILENLNYEAGCNPVNVCYVTGLGWKRQREIVHQYAQNDRRVLPPSGLPLGNIQSGFQYLDHYQSELGKLSFPDDGAVTAPFPFYDRWSDTHNVATEFVLPNLGRSLASLAFVAALTPLKTQAWTTASAQISVPSEVPINVPVTATLQVAGLDVTDARVVWEARDQQPAFGPTFTFTPVQHGVQWVEAEAQWPDGRRVFATHSFRATNGLPAVSVLATDDQAAEADLDGAAFTFFRAGAVSAAVTVNFRLSGTATKFIDYRRPEGDMPEFFTIPAGLNSATMSIVPVNDATFEGPETVTLTLSPAASYNVESPNSATFTIADDDLTIKEITRAESGNVVVTWFSVPGKVYRVEYSGTLMPLSWTQLSGEIAAEGSTTSWMDTTARADAERFFRVIEVR